MNDSHTYPFPSLAELRGLLRDHPIDDAIYSEAKRLFENRSRQTPTVGGAVSIEFYIRQCVQLAICQRIQQQTVAAKGIKAHDPCP